MGDVKILIIDDEKPIRGMLKNFLMSQEFIVDTAENGDQGIEILKTKIYDIVISDFTMPGNFFGLNLIKKIHKISPNTKIISISGYSADTHEKDILNVGAYCFLMKPFRLEQLLMEIKNITEK